MMGKSSFLSVVGLMALIFLVSVSQKLIFQAWDDSDFKLFRTF